MGNVGASKPGRLQDAPVRVTDNTHFVSVLVAGTTIRGHGIPK